MMDKPHKKLDVWQKAMSVAKTIYKLTSAFPAGERFGLIAQMRRAAVSIPCNIAEGAARQGKKEFRNFLSMAQGSLSELDTQVDLAVMFDYLKLDDLGELTNQMQSVDKMLTGLIRSLNK